MVAAVPPPSVTPAETQRDRRRLAAVLVLAALNALWGALTLLLAVVLVAQLLDVTTGVLTAF